MQMKHIMDSFDAQKEKKGKKAKKLKKNGTKMNLK